MNYVWIWSIIGIVLLILEMITVTFFPIFLALAAFCTALLSFATNDPFIQVIAFALLSVLFTWFGKPILTRFFKVNNSIRDSNVDALIGVAGIVTMDIKENSMGQVKVDGSIWSAVSSNGHALLEGTRIEVVAVHGVKLVVKSIS